MTPKDRHRACVAGFVIAFFGMAITASDEWGLAMIFGIFAFGFVLCVLNQPR